LKRKKNKIYIYLLEIHIIQRIIKAIGGDEEIQSLQKKNLRIDMGRKIIKLIGVII
jgi:hypothetical protein